MEHRARMGVRSRVLEVALLCAAASSLAIPLSAGTASPLLNPSPAQSQGQDESSSSHKTPRKPGQKSHHTRVAEEDSSSELAKAEELIQKQDYAAAEPLLQKSVEGDPANH